MTELAKHFQNFFLDPKITPVRLESFTDDHLEKLIANNVGGVYDAIIADTTAARNNFHTRVVAKGTQESQLLGSTITKDVAAKGLINFMRVKSNFIADKFGKPSAGYSAFYPQGLTAWTNATDQGLIDMAAVAVEAANLHVVTVGLVFKDDLTALRDAYVAAESGQTTEKGDVAAARVLEIIAEHDLQLQLTVNVHTIGIQQIGFPANEIANTFFDESLLFAKHFRHYYKSEVAPESEKAACTFTYHATSHFTIEHHSAKPLTWQMTLAGVKVGTPVTTTIGQKVNMAFSDFAADGDTLLVTNAENVQGIYKVIQVS